MNYVSGVLYVSIGWLTMFELWLIDCLLCVHWSVFPQSTKQVFSTAFVHSSSHTQLFSTISQMHFQMLIQDSLFLHLLSLALQTCQSHAAFPKLLVDVLPVLPMLLMTHCMHLTLSRVADCLRSASSKTTGRTCCIFCANWTSCLKGQKLWGVVATTQNPSIFRVLVTL